EYAGETNNANVYLNSASPTITNSTIKNSSSDGIYGSGSPVINTSDISSNGGAGMYIVSGSPTLTNNSLNNNATYPISTDPNSCSNFGTNTAFDNGTTNKIEIRGGRVGNNSTTWPNTGLSYLVTGDIYIYYYSGYQDGNVTLTIAPGVRITFNQSAGLYVGGGGVNNSEKRGALNAQGTVAEPIIFTSSLQTSAPGSWKGIYFQDRTDDALTQLNYCTIEYAGEVNNANVYLDNASPTITNSTITNSSGAGIYVASGFPTLANNSLNNNATYPISTDPNYCSGFGAGNTASGNGLANSIELRVGRVGNNSTTWPNTGLSYLVTGDIYIYYYSGYQDGNVTLTIAPGVRITFNQSAGLYVGGGGVNNSEKRGALNAQGTVAEPIIFTSSLQTSAPGSWKGIYFQDRTDDALTQLNYCTIEYAGETNNANVYLNSASPGNMSHLVLSNGSGYGLYTTNSSTNVQHSNIFSNSVGGINNVTSNLIYAEYSWWGDPSGPSGVGSGVGQSVSEHVAYEPWLGEPYDGNFYFDDVSVSPNAFNQNGGATTFHAQVTENSNWQITIKDNTQAVVKTFSGSGTTINQDWFGDDQNNQPLVNGTYTYAISAQSIDNPTRIASLVGRLILDDTIPLCKITSPVTFSFVSNDIQIMGTAAGQDFSSYKVEYGIGQYPASWITIATGTIPVTNGLLAQWDTTGFDQPVYTIRLTVTNAQQGTVTDSITVKALSVFNLMDSVDPFSPNNDQIKDNTTISATFTYSSDWVLNIKDASQVVKRTFSGSGLSMTQTWDGKDNEAQVLPDATYSYQISITEPGSAATAVSAIGQSTIDNTLPTVLISAPVSGGNISGTVSITGTANDLHFQSYRVDYGIGTDPATWNSIQGETMTPVVDGTLAVWDVIDMTNGDYVIRLTVDDTTGNVSTASVPVIVDNIRITDVSVDPYVFNPSNTETTNIAYTIDRDCQVSLKIYDLNDNLIKTVIDSIPQTAGAQAVAWDGKNDSGVIAPDAAYTFIIEATNGIAFGEYVPEYIPDAVAVTNFTSSDEFDPHHNRPYQMNYDLADYAQVLIRIGGTWYYDPNWVVIDWEPRAPGANVDYWNGRDSSGNVVDLSAVNVAVWTRALPDEPIIIVNDLTVSVTTDPYCMISSYGEFTAITYTISKPVNVTVAVYDTAGALVKTLEDNLPQPAGAHTLTWDGTGSGDGVVAQEGDFTVRVTATGADGKTKTAFGNITVY
ncbi:MAG TPA: FlgD immunoglobulin-like domain containing protein, partial [Candidatus Omnitrophota bacterium]|nr:FlgD immunoglobulin-like domain containing protein [Candidatus Omnitrophota bacterium]